GPRDRVGVVHLRRHVVHARHGHHQLGGGGLGGRGGRGHRPSPRRSASTCARRYRRCPPNVITNWRRPAFAHRVTVLASTRNSAATSAGVISSGGSGRSACARLVVFAISVLLLRLVADRQPLRRLPDRGGGGADVGVQVVGVGVFGQRQQRPVHVRGAQLDQLGARGGRVAGRGGGRVQGVADRGGQLLRRGRGVLAHAAPPISAATHSSALATESASSRSQSRSSGGTDSSSNPNASCSCTSRSAPFR